MKNTILLLLLSACLFSCQTTETPADPKSYPARTPAGINVVVEIPAGTNKKIEYQPSSGSFEVDKREGKPRQIDFLPYPGNYGFIPSTRMSKSEGGDGDAIDVLLLCEALPTGSVIEARPIGALQLLDEGELDTKVIAIPIDTNLQTLAPQDFTDFSIHYDGARHIIETWFLYYDGLGTNTFEGWLDESKTLALIAHYEE
ncbi:MAG: inorganic diphosphatase [Phaeodactylibacter sp.]|uniref:inorganic diphosphatase n=1 Tax=Phaeodactylibacter sp. TaxID=1940289 RepID=UPI0032EAE687